jgi:hypothetical protein
LRNFVAKRKGGNRGKNELSVIVPYCGRNGTCLYAVEKDPVKRKINDDVAEVGRIAKAESQTKTKQ